MLFGAAERLAQATHSIRIRISLRMGPPPSGSVAMIADRDQKIVTEMSFKMGRISESMWTQIEPVAV
jgi:hypothetical protein